MRRRHTHREVLAWSAWLSEDMNRPSRTDYYLARVACEVRRSYVKHPGRVREDEFIIKFISRKVPVGMDLDEDDVRDELEGLKGVGRGNEHPNSEKYGPPVFSRKRALITQQAKQGWLAMLGGKDKVRIINK